MDSKTLERIFEPFFSTKQKDDARGTGLGLSLVDQLIKNFGGTIHVESKVNKGTSFKIILPCMDESPAITRDQEEEEMIEPGQAHILFVDDEAALCEIGKEVLTEHGFIVTGFTDGQAALEDFKNHNDRYDMVITDYSMPSLSGRDLLAGIKSVKPEIASIIATGQLNLASEENRIKWGCDAIIEKPYNITTLVKAAKALS